MGLGGGVNDQCHQHSENVQRQDGHIIPHPRVKVILWGHFYVEHPDAAATVRELVTALVAGRFMNGLAQYGVSRGSLVDVTVVDTGASDPTPSELSDGDAADQLKRWLQVGFIAPAPAVNETNLLYLLFPPTSTVLTPADEGFCGYHRSTKFNGASDNDDLFWATFRTNTADQSSGDSLIRSIAFCISHEMNEAFTDRDSNGYIASNGCEIGDLCETFGSPSGNVTMFPYQGFNIERYWSNWDHGCIEGNRPVRLSTFLKAAAPHGAVPPGVRWLGMSKIGLDSIAARVRSK
jgi:hypothetical protein